MSTTVGIFLNRHHLNKEGKASISVRITHNRVKRYYPLGLTLTPEIFDKLMTAKRRTDSEREIYDLVQAAELRAKEVIKELPIFTFGLFEERFLSERAAIGTVSGAFDSYINELDAEGRVSTAESYETAKNSLIAFRKDLRFADITPKLLKEYERYMLKSEKSITTVGIYLRNLRTIYNREKIDKSIYPFGKGKYEIPTGRNIKKALSLDDVVSIANYQAENDFEAFARDFWILSFQCNGMNIKDILHLKRSDIDGDMITYVREKTARTKREVEKVQVSLKPESKDIIKRWGNVIDLNDKDPYIFPFLRKNMTPKEIRRTTGQVIKNINKGMEKIGESLGIKGELTTYYARHSFATLLKRSGVSTEFISDALGHANIATTKNYLASFEDDVIHKQTEILTGLKRKTE